MSPLVSSSLIYLFCPVDGISVFSQQFGCCRVSLETQTLAEQSDSCKSEARLAPNFANSSDGVDDSVDTRGVEDDVYDDT